MRRARLAELTAALAMTTSACSLLTSLDGLSNAPVDSPLDGAVADSRSDGPSEVDGAPEAADGGSSVLDVRDAGDEAGPNLHPQGTFETGTCDPWSGFQGSVNIVSLGHSGTGACRACTAASTTDYFTGDDNGAPGPVVVGASYVAEGWVRTDPSSPAPPRVVLVLRNFTLKNNVFLDQESHGSPFATIDASWTRFESSLDITKPGTLNVFISADTAPGACFLFDDVVVRRVK